MIMFSGLSFRLRYMHVIVLHMDNFKARSVKSGNRETSSETRSPHPKPEMQEPPKTVRFEGPGKFRA